MYLTDTFVFFLLVIRILRLSCYWRKYFPFLFVVKPWCLKFFVAWSVLTFLWQVKSPVYQGITPLPHVCFLLNTCSLFLLLLLFHIEHHSKSPSNISHQYIVLFKKVKTDCLVSFKTLVLIHCTSSKIYFFSFNIIESFFYVGSLAKFEEEISIYIFLFIMQFLVKWILHVTIFFVFLSLFFSNDFGVSSWCNG